MGVSTVPAIRRKTSQAKLRSIVHTYPFEVMRVECLVNSTELIDFCTSLDQGREFTSDLTVESEGDVSKSTD